MYTFLEGQIDAVGAVAFAINVQGVGYELHASTKTLSTLKKGDNRRVLTHLHIAEGVLALYGFSDEHERLMFRRLISISRVGPKLALAALSSMRPSEIATAIVCEDDSLLSRVPGLGKKTAQRIILELKEKISQETDIAGLNGLEMNNIAAETGIHGEAIAALAALGYDVAIASRAVYGVQDAQDVQTLIKQALRSLA